MRILYILGRQVFRQYFLGSFLSLPFENRKVIPDVNHVGMFFGSLIISLIALVRLCMTESCLIQKFCNLSNPGYFQLCLCNDLIILSTMKSGVTCSWAFFCLIQVALSLWLLLYLFYTKNVLFVALYVVLELQVSGYLSDDKISWHLHLGAYFASSDYLFLCIF